MSSPLALQVNGVFKNFGDVKALEGVTFEVRRGECFGLLGPNGAGKSTTLKMIYGHLQPSRGDLFVLGMNAKTSGRDVRARLGVVPQDEGLDPELSVRENLEVFARFFGIKAAAASSRILDLLKAVRLDAVIDRPVDQLSGGMKRRLAIARSLLSHPEILILDEPTVGLDPQVRIWVWEFLKKIKEQEVTQILTTHYMEEAEQLCDRLAIMDKGRILAIGSPQELIDLHLNKHMVEFELDPKDMTYYLNRMKEVHRSYFVVGRQVFVSVENEVQAREIMGMISSPRISSRRTTLSDVFLSLAGHDIKEDW